MRTPRAGTARASSRPPRREHAQALVRTVVRARSAPREGVSARTMAVELVGDGPVTIRAGSNLKRMQPSEQGAGIDAVRRHRPRRDQDRGGRRRRRAPRARRARHPTPTSGGPADVAAAMAAALTEAATAAPVEPAQLRGVGVGSPGPRRRAGRHRLARRQPARLVRQLPARRGAAVGARHAGRARQRRQRRDRRGVRARRGQPYDSLLGVFWGTGVGGGLILDGKPWHGRGGAGEIGHMVIVAGRPPLPVRAPRLRRGLRGARRDGGPRAQPARQGREDEAVRAGRRARPRPADERHLGSAHSSTATSSRPS